MSTTGSSSFPGFQSSFGTTSTAKSGTASTTTSGTNSSKTSGSASGSLYNFNFQTPSTTNSIGSGVTTQKDDNIDYKGVQYPNETPIQWDELKLTSKSFYSNIVDTQETKQDHPYQNVKLTPSISTAQKSLHSSLFKSQNETIFLNSVNSVDYHEYGQPIVLDVTEMQAFPPKNYQNIKMTPEKFQKDDKWIQFSLEGSGTIEIISPNLKEKEELSYDKLQYFITHLIIEPGYIEIPRDGCILDSNAIITMEEIFPDNKKDQQSFQQHLKNYCNAINAIFLSYNINTGRFQFMINDFQHSPYHPYLIPTK